MPFAKGGEYSPYYADFHLVVNWERDGAEMKEWADPLYNNSGWSRIIKNVDLYFRPGLTWPERTTSGYAVQLLPPGVVISHIGQGIYFEVHDQIIQTLAVHNTRPYQYFEEMLIGLGEETVSGSAARHYSCGSVAKLPFSLALHRKHGDRLASLASVILECRRLLVDSSESAWCFTGSRCSQRTIKGGVIKAQEEYLTKCLCAIRCSSEIESIVRTECGLNSEIEEIQSVVGPHPSLDLDATPKPSIDEKITEIAHSSIDALIDEAADAGLAHRSVTKKSYFVSRIHELLAQWLGCSTEAVIGRHLNSGVVPLGAYEEATRAIISQSIGGILGRWDIRIASGASQAPKQPGHLDPLPSCSPGMLKGPDGLPATRTPDNYPFRINWDGILVDDPDHSEDIIRRVRDVLEVVWKDQADAIETEACEILGVADLRDYFRKPGAGGFWDDHVKRYSKSRRKAPIYWLLQSSKKNYALWIYYHRLNKDILFKALLNYVEPKIRREESRLDELRSQKTALGPAAKGAKKLDKDIDRQDAFLSELRDFEDKLRRAANLHLDPDLNDGVVLNIAPLRELVPWKEAKSYWDDLMDGKYEWSSIGKQLREKGLVK